MKTVLSALVLSLSTASAAFAAGPDACQIAIAKSIAENESLSAIMGEVNPADVNIASREDALLLASGLIDNEDLLAALKNPAAQAYQPGFHLLYVAVPAAAACEILAVGQGD